MRIILLSGGSGRTLWPLSNETRSKQFLRLLNDKKTGKDESMIQRVVRQIRDVGLDIPITVATNEHQKDSIETHLGKNVDIVTEPSRRDTFPAVALACEYLIKTKHCDDDEVIVVMPCDQYTEPKYFTTAYEMGRIAEGRDVSLVVMGILPDFPSTKFGYIVPSSTSSEFHDYFPVSEFVEKPSEEMAKSLIARGAYWNGGVFAFKLGFLRRIAEKYIKESSFEAIRDRYDEYPAISFDYEVAEKTSDILMVPFSGLWKDLGTWEALLAEIDNSPRGEVVTEKNVNTHILNELQIPILCVGTRNLVVAASADGILIADKSKTERIKEYTEGFKNRPMFEERRWGIYQVIDHISFPDKYETLTKRLSLNPGCSISYQRHKFRDETWTFIDGKGVLVIDGVRRDVKRGDTVFIRKGTKHALLAVTSLTFIEVQAGSNLVETDIERFPWDWEAEQSGSTQ